MHPESSSLYTILIVTTITTAVLLAAFITSVHKFQKKVKEASLRTLQKELNLMEKERIRVSQDLHDGFGPHLSGIKLFLSRVTPNNKSGIEALEAAKGYIDDSVNLMRNIAKDLMPPSMQIGMIWNTIEDYLQDLSKKTDFKITLSQRSTVNISEEYGMYLYRIIQEIAHNTLKHSGATFLDIQIIQDAQLLYITCKEDGKGFDPYSIPKENQGMGLKTMYKRTSILKGKLFIEPEKSGGMKYSFEIPITSLYE